MLLDKPPPHDNDAEQAVLGALLIDQTALEIVAEALHAHDFYAERHQRIFDAAMAVRPKMVDLVTVSDELSRRKALSDVGGTTYLSGLVAGVPTTANAGAYAEIVRHKSRLRRAIRTCLEAIDRLPTADEDELLHIGGSLSLAVDDSPRHEFEDVVRLGDVAVARVAKLRVTKPGTLQGIASGYRSVDYITGGFMSRETSVIAARPGMGKTGWSLELARRIAMATEKALLFASLEMDEMRLADRQVMSIGRLDGTRYQRILLRPEEWDQAARAAAKLQEVPIFATSAALTLDDIRNRARWLHSRMGGVGAVVVDYLQLVYGSHRDRRQNRQEEVAGISRGLKRLAVELGCPVIALSQLSRAVESRPDKRPNMADVRESGAIEQDAALVILLYRDDYYAEQSGRESENPGIVEVIVGKNRYGAVGTAKLKFHPQWQAFDDLELRQESAGPVPGRRPYDG